MDQLYLSFSLIIYILTLKVLPPDKKLVLIINSSMIRLKTHFKHLIEDFLVLKRYICLINIWISFWLYIKKLIKIKKSKP